MSNTSNIQALSPFFWWSPGLCPQSRALNTWDLNLWHQGQFQVLNTHDPWRRLWSHLSLNYGVFHFAPTFVILIAQPSCIRCLPHQSSRCPVLLSTHPGLHIFQISVILHPLDHSHQLVSPHGSYINHLISSHPASFIPASSILLSICAFPLHTFEIKLSYSIALCSNHGTF